MCWKAASLIENRNSTGKKLKERRRDIIKNSEENERKENDRKKKYWAWTRQQLVHVLTWTYEPVAAGTEERDNTTTNPLPPNHFGLHYVIACNSENVSCMFSHVLRPVLGADHCEYARPGWSYILMTQFSPDFNRLWQKRWWMWSILKNKPIIFKIHWL